MVHFLFTRAMTASVESAINTLYSREIYAIAYSQRAGLTSTTGRLTVGIRYITTFIALALSLTELLIMDAFTAKNTKSMVPLQIIQQ